MKCIFCLSALLLALLVNPPTARAADAIGTVVALQGVVRASGPAGSRRLLAGSALFEDDRVSVGAGHAQFLLRDGTRLVAGPQSNLHIDRFLMRKGSNHAQALALRAMRGTFRFISDRTPRSAVSITTRHATIGIRGTGFDFWVRAKTGVVVLKGVVAMRGRRGGVGVTMSAGCSMGVATPSAAKLLQGQEKRDTIVKNLPFLTDQSDLAPAFRLPIGPCGLASP